MLQTKGWGTAEPPSHMGFSPLWPVLRCSSSGNAPSAPATAGAPALPLGPGGHFCSMSSAGVPHGAAEGKTQQMHGQARVKAHQPGRDCPSSGELSCLVSYCAMHRGGGCTSPSGNSSSCCPSPDPARAVFPALRRTMLQQHGTGGSYLGSPCSTRCQVAHRRMFPSGCRN